MDFLRSGLSASNDLFFSETLDIMSNTSNEKYGELTVTVSRENGIVFVQAICDGIVEDTRCGSKVEAKLSDTFETLAQIQTEYVHIADEANDTRSVQSTIEIAERTVNQPIRVTVNDWKTSLTEESLIELDNYNTFLSSGASFVLFRLLAQKFTEATLPLATLDSKGKLASLTLIANIKRAILRDSEGAESEQYIVAIEKKVEDGDKNNENWRIYLKQTGELLLWEHIGDPVVMRAAEQIIDLLPDNDVNALAVDDDKSVSTTVWQDPAELSDSSFGLSLIFDAQADDDADELSMSEIDQNAQIVSDTETSFIDLSHAESEEMANYSRQQSAALPSDEYDPFAQTSAAQNTDPIDLKNVIVGAVPNQPVQERSSQMSFHYDEGYFHPNEAPIAENTTNPSQAPDNTVKQWVSKAVDEAVVVEENMLPDDAQQQKDTEAERRESSSSQSSLSDTIDYNLAWLFGRDEDVKPIGDRADSKQIKKRPQVSWQQTTTPRSPQTMDGGSNGQLMSPTQSVRSRVDSLASENMTELLQMFENCSSPSIIVTSPFARPPTPQPNEIPTDDEGFHSQQSSHTTPVTEEPSKYEPGMYANLWAKLKQNTSLSCYKYLEEHPDLSDMLTDYMQCLLITQPKDIREFSAMYFTILNSMK